MARVVWAPPLTKIIRNSLDQADIYSPARHAGSPETGISASPWKEEAETEALRALAELEIPRQPNVPAVTSLEEAYIPLPPTIQDRYVLAKNQASGFPFALRHPFLEWLNTFLEGTYHAAARKLGRPVSQSYDLCEWNHAQGGAISLYRAFTIKDSEEWSEILCGAEMVRHEHVHRRDISAAKLVDAMSLPELLGDHERCLELSRVFDLLLAASEQSATQTTIEDFHKAVAIPPLVLDERRTPFFKAMQQRIEKALFEYTKKYNPKFFENSDYTMPEQIEMPEWDRYYRRDLVDKDLWIPDAVQDLYIDDHGYLLSNCVAGARLLRNDADHRHEERETSDVLIHVHRSIMCLNVLGDHEAAVEVEILAEQWFTKASRAEVLQRLESTYLDEDLDAIWDPLLRRRETRRRGVLTKILKPTSLSSNMENIRSVSNMLAKPSMAERPPQPTASESPLPSPSSKSSQPPQIPDSITVRGPDDWDFRRLTFYSSMHPDLMVLPVPWEDDIWSKQSKQLEDWNRAWAISISDGFAETVDVERDAETAKHAYAFEAEMRSMEVNEAQGRGFTKDGLADCSVYENSESVSIKTTKPEVVFSPKLYNDQRKNTHCREVRLQDAGHGLEGTGCTHIEDAVSSDEDYSSWDGDDVYDNEGPCDDNAQPSWVVVDVLTEGYSSDDQDLSVETETFDGTWCNKTSDLDVNW